MQKLKLWVIVLFCPLLATAWWDVGHMLTAAIAEIRLSQINPYSLNKFTGLIHSINNLVDERSQTMIECACWPDDLKGYQYNMHLWDSWHFINSPFVDNGVFPQINYTGTVLNSINVVDEAHRVLTTNVDNNTAERALFARYLVHLAGDIHQPLHSVAFYNQSFPKGDAGGNKIKITLLDGTEDYNLHSFWDSGALRVQNDSFGFDRPLTPETLAEFTAYARTFIEEWGEEVKEEAKNIEPVDWAEESLQLCQDIVYPHFFDTNKVTQDYSDLTYATAKRRITLAGYRLANFIVDVYDPEGKHSHKENPHKKSFYREEMKGPRADRMRKITERMQMNDYDL